VELWRVGLVTNLLGVAVLLAVAAIARHRVRSLRRLAIPDGIVAGVLGLVLGPGGLGVIAFDRGDLELMVYHGFAIVFVAVGLQTPAPRVGGTGSARSLAVAFVTMAVIQALLGFGFVAVWASATGEALHPGFGWMPTLGFSQGPGQALAFGSAWEQAGMHHGTQLGLIFAALGFAACCGLGIPLVAWGRRRGWASTPGFDERERDVAGEAVAGAPASAAAGGLSAQLVAIGCVYAATFGVLWALTRALPRDSAVVATLWGFHFITGSILAIGLRRLAARRRIELACDDRLLAGISVAAVDFTTVAALSAISIAVLEAFLAPILVLSALVGLTTVLVGVWLGRRAFPSAPFEHAVVLIGAATGTIPTGLALLRMLDPELTGPVARNVVLASAISVPIGAPLFMGVIPATVALWDRGLVAATLGPLAMLATYALALALIWRAFTPLRLLRPLARPWPDRR
jgi:ESS family glutamate:Na+ symporter